MSPYPLLKIEQVTKSYDDTVLALDNVDLEVSRGEIVCLLGPSGCGKTTLLRVVAGLEETSQGGILLDNTDLSTVPVHRRHFGYMFQEFALFPHKSVSENIAFGLRMQDLPAARIEERVHEMLALVGLAGYGNRSVFELSGGQRQRVALARSLAPEPQLVLLDEPLGSLDRTLRETLMGELRGILKQVDVTAIYVTHDQEEAFAIGDRIAIMLAGRIAQLGPPEEVYKRPGNTEIARFLGFTSLLPIQCAPGENELLHTPLGDLPRKILADSVPPQGGYLLVRTESARAARPPDHGQVQYPYLSVDSQENGTRLRLAGYLEECSFRGSQYRLVVRVPAGDEGVRMQFDLPAYQSDLTTGRLHPLPIPAVGEPVWLTVFPELTTVLPKDPAEQSRNG